MAYVIKKNWSPLYFYNYLFGPNLKYTKMTQSNYFFCATGPI